MPARSEALIRRNRLWQYSQLLDPSQEFVAIDLETTGLSPQYSRIIEVAAVRFNLKGKTLGTYDSLGRPDGQYMHGAEEIHGISHAQVLAAPSLLAVLAELLSFVGASPVIAHNMSFENRFLTAELLHYNVPLVSIDGICTYQAAKDALPGHPSYKLNDLIKNLRLSESRPSHRALPDTLACAALFRRIVRTWKQNACPLPPKRPKKPKLPAFTEGGQFQSYRYDSTTDTLTAIPVPTLSAAIRAPKRNLAPGPRIANPTGGSSPASSVPIFQARILTPRNLVPLPTAFHPTPEQAAILDAFLGGGDIKITAGAGTGKTSTLRMLAQATHTTGTYIAFNRAIATEAQRSFPSNVSASTAHSLAARSLRSTGHGAVIDKLSRARIPLRSMASFLGVEDFRLYDVGGQPRHLDEVTLTQAVLDAVQNFCQSADERLGVQHIEPILALDAPGDTTNSELLAEYVLPYAEKAWVDITDASGTGIKFDHDHYLKLWALTAPRIGRDGDMLLVDESQDLNPVLASVIATQDHMQKIYVGDANQAIYGFTGAIDALSTFEAHHSMSLTQSWRFGQTIAELANGWLQDLGSTLQLSGNPSRTSKLTGRSTADAVLCRTNATAVGEVMRAQEQGLSVSLSGGGEDALWFVRDARKLKDGSRPSHRNLSAFSRWTDVIEYVQHIRKPSEMKTWVTLINSFGEPALEQALETLAPESTARLAVSTAHKAKGREWDAVRIAPDFLVQRRSPVPNNQKDLKELRAEQMLAYVAVTRARHQLNPGTLGEEQLPDDRAPEPVTVTLTAAQQEALAAQLGTDFQTWLAHQP